MNPGSGDKKEDNQRRVFYSASFVRQENPGIPVRIKQICTVYSSTAHQHVCTKGMPMKVGLHPGKKLVRSNPTESSRHDVISYSESGY
ncbi:Uncharacterised protein [Prevotella denticola]|uniref:Uncharacterized protein n=1 Tax=Prevotella denticola TaxID=28129 RepID=A0A379EC84_9BACT|nr:Uncharacterised protein [Prevotella denticola]